MQIKPLKNKKISFKNMDIIKWLLWHPPQWRPHEPNRVFEQPPRLSLYTRKMFERLSNSPHFPPHPLFMSLTGCCQSKEFWRTFLTVSLSLWPWETDFLLLFGHTCGVRPSEKINVEVGSLRVVEVGRNLFIVCVGIRCSSGKLLKRYGVIY